ncbi:MAG: Rrf2 family transcriptional regulator [Phycisphaerales bacterium]
MDILRRNTDYALRLLVGLTKRGGGTAVATRVLAKEQDVPYQLACKLMQQLHAAKLVQSCMGPKGGFRLGGDPDAISLLDVVRVIQGPLSLNRCLLNDACCPRKEGCPVRARMGELQGRMDEYLGSVTLAELLRTKEGVADKADGAAGRTK